ncbi:MAG TPA: lipid-binding SYLF domain-containing protein [Arenimonas sp.]|nr:lipid-binding SYLF domain-containing protein [Arenimonas sp.]
MRVLIAILLLITSSVSWAKVEPEKTTKDALVVLQAMTKMPENSIPEKLLAEAYAIAVVPKVGEVSFVFGGHYGKGLISIRGKDGAWSNPNFITVTGGSFGFQAGVQQSDLILVFTSEVGVNKIVKGKFTMGADAAVAAGPVGRNVQASTDTSFKAEILSYSRSRGLFAGVALDGSVISIDNKANVAMYGDMISPSSIFDGRTQTQNQSIIDFRNLLEESSSREVKK